MAARFLRLKMKAIPSVNLLWMLPAVAVTAFFASKGSIVHDTHAECSAAMAKQIEHLREIVSNYRGADTRLMAEKQDLLVATDEALHALGKQTQVFTSTREGPSACEFQLRDEKRKLSQANDELVLTRTELLSKLEETQDQLKNSEALLDAAAKELNATRVKLNQALEEQQSCYQKQGFAGKDVTAVGGDRSFQGYKCGATEEDMKRYLNYSPGASCPNDWYFVQRLIFKKNCFALPRRKCRVPTPSRPADPLPFPQALFDQNSLKNRNVRWDLHQYNSFEELNSRQAGDCKNCFNMSMELDRWREPYRGTIPMKDVVEMKKGTLRLGLDVGGGTGSFAAHMAKFGVTVMTTAFNVETRKENKAGLPYMETIAARGLIPLHVPHASRLPLYDGVLDVVHSVNSIKYIPIPDFEELIYEWDRVLRVGGIFWFEMFYAPVTQMPKYVAVLEQLGYKKLYWNFSKKPEKGEVSGEHVYLNCVLEKQPAPGRQVLVGPLEEDMESIV